MARRIHSCARINAWRPALLRVHIAFPAASFLTASKDFVTWSAGEILSSDDEKTATMYINLVASRLIRRASSRSEPRYPRMTCVDINEGARDRRFLLETSLVGVFAVEEVRGGNRGTPRRLRRPQQFNEALLKTLCG